MPEVEHEPTLSNGVHPNGVEETDSPVIARAKRILSGDIRSEDYLVVTPEIEAEVQATAARQAVENGVTIIPEGFLTLLRQSYAIQFHCGGKETICRRSENGVVVLASGWENVLQVIRKVPPHQRPGFVTEFPEPWEGEAIIWHL